MLTLVLAQAVSGAGMSAKDKEFLRWHNIARCVVGSPPHKWDPALATYATNHCASMGSGLSHSDSYGAINAGENLAMNGRGSVEMAVYDQWFEGEFFSGGHYTAMVWKGGDTLGCAFNTQHNTFCCNYGSTSGQIPNGGRNKAGNVPGATVKSKAECTSEVDNAATPAPSTTTAAVTAAPPGVPPPGVPPPPGATPVPGGPDSPTTPEEEEEDESLSTVELVCIGAAGFFVLVLCVMLFRGKSSNHKPATNYKHRDYMHDYSYQKSRPSTASRSAQSYSSRSMRSQRWY